MDTIQYKKDEALIMKIMLYAQLLSVLFLLIPACNKDNDKSYLSVRLTDTFGNFEAVMIDVQSVEISGNDGSTIILSTNTGIYNLLDFSNGLNTIIAKGDFDAGTISQIRLILGANNTVIVDGIVYALSTPGDMQSGLKLKVDKKFEPGVSYTILLDFDANQSIVSQGKGDYQLKPVIRIIDASTSGSLKGSINPAGIVAVMANV
jgi:hypothetical protein